MANILVIDDDPLVVGTIEILLMKAGYTVTVARDGDKGVKAFTKDRHDLVITDIIMPEKEGIETIREIRALSATVPIIAVSGGGRTKNFDFLRIADKVGANEVLRKPFANDQLLTLVARCLESR
jgi:DNA-binding response OmpR family regulator